MNTPIKTAACSSSRAVAFAIQDLTSCRAFGSDHLCAKAGSCQSLVLVRPIETAIRIDKMKKQRIIRHYPSERGRGPMRLTIVTRLRLLAVAVGLGLAGCSSSTSTAISTTSPTSSAPVFESTAPDKIVAAIADARREGTITGPVQWVSTSTKGFASVSGSGPGAADVPIYAIEMRGRFVLDNAPRPAGAKSPEGSIMIVLVPVGDGDQAGGGVLLRPTVTDLSSFGHAHWYRGNG